MTNLSLPSHSTYVLLPSLSTLSSPIGENASSVESTSASLAILVFVAAARSDV